MKILHITAIGHHAEGIGSVLKELVPQQIALGHDIRIISIHQNKIYPELDVCTIDTQKDFKLYLDRWTPDCVLFHSVYKKSYIFMYKMLLSCGIPYFVQMHGCLSEENYAKNHLKKWIANKLFFNPFLKNARSIVYLSQQEYDRCIVKAMNPSHIIIPNGTVSHKVDLSQSLPNNHIEIVFIGRISLVIKGLDKLLSATDLLRNRTDIHFSIYGNETDQDVSLLRQLIADKKGYVDYYGGAYGEKKDSVMRNAHIFILTSPSEGMPMGVLESLSYGVPCIVTPGTNMSEVIESNNAGWRAKYDALDIAHVIETAIDEYRKHPLLLRQNAYRLSKHYSWDHVAGLSIDQLGASL